MKHNRKALLAIIVALVTVITLFTGCKKMPPDSDPSSHTSDVTPTSPSEPKETMPSLNTDNPNENVEAVVTLAQAADPNTLDPHKAFGDIGGMVADNICETLYEFNEKSELVPLLAESCERIGENEWVYHLKENITFSNGEPFDAEAVLWNFERANSNEYPRQSFEFREYYDHGEVMDKYTVKLVTKLVDENAAVNFSEVPMLAPKHSTDIGEDAIGTDIIGTGPYTLESWDKDQQIVLKARDDYWGGAPEVKKYIIRTIPEAATRIAELLTGAIDIAYEINFEDLDILQKHENISVKSKTGYRVFYIAFNTCDWSPAPELKDKRVRQAINYAVDQKAIVDTILGGYGYVLPTIWREDMPDYIIKDTDFEYNPEKAKELLKDAGYEDGFTVKCQVRVGTPPKSVEVAQAVASYLEKVNIKMEVLPIEYNTMRSIIINGQDSHKAEGMFFWSWTSKPSICDGWLTGIIHSTGMTSYNAIPGYDEIIDNILAEHDSAKKTELLKTFQNMLVDDPPFLCLYQLVNIYGLSNRIDWNPDDYYSLLAKDIKLR